MDSLSSHIKTEMENDESMELAFKEAELTQNLGPLIKQELKYTILNRRHKSGQGELVLEEKKTPPKRELTADEVKKKLRRKEQNRRAAAKCRTKKKALAEQVIAEYLEEQKNTATLQAEIEKLRREKETLVRILNDHAFTCTRAMTPTPVTPSYEDQSTFQYGVSPNPYPRDSVTPFQDQPDPFDDPNMQFCDMASHMKMPVTNQISCTQTISDIPLLEMDLPESLIDFTFFQSEPLELQQGGRTSISEYIDSEGVGGL